MRARLAALALALLLAGSAGGCLYTNIRVPLDTDFAATELGAKQGISRNFCLLWLVAWGDGGTRAAAENGGLRVISHADREVFSVLFGLWSTTRTVVYGD